MAMPTSIDAPERDDPTRDLSQRQRGMLWLGTGIALLGSLLVIASYFVPWVQVTPDFPISFGNLDYYSPLTLLTQSDRQFAAVLFLVPLLVTAGPGIFALVGFLRRRPGHLPRTSLGWAITMCLLSPFAIEAITRSLNFALFQASVTVSGEPGIVLAFAGFGFVFVGAVLLGIGRRGEIAKYYRVLHKIAERRTPPWKPPAFWTGGALALVGSLLVLVSLLVPWAHARILSLDQRYSLFIYLDIGYNWLAVVIFLAAGVLAAVPAFFVLVWYVRQRVLWIPRLLLDIAKLACIVGPIAILAIFNYSYAIQNHGTNLEALPAVGSGWVLALVGFVSGLAGAVLLGMGRSGSRDNYYPDDYSTEMD